MAFCGLGAARDWLLTVALGLRDRRHLRQSLRSAGPAGARLDRRDRGHVPGAPVHAVRDFILVMFGPWPWPTFNLADSSLVCGAALLLWHAFVSKAEVKAESEEPAPKNEELPAVRS